MNHARIQIVLVEDIRIADVVFKAGNFSFELRLLVHRLIIFGVFGKVAERTRNFDALGYLISAGGFELLELLDLGIVALSCLHDLLFHFKAILLP